MKVCLRHNQEEQYLQKADQIEVKHAYIDKLLDLIQKYPNKDYIIDVPAQKPTDWKSISMCKAGLTEGHKIYIRAHDLNLFLTLHWFEKYDLPFFYSEPAKTYYDLYNLKKLGVAYAYVDAPLFFDLDNVKKVGIPLRIMPNRAYKQGDIPRLSGLHGTWVRPEKLNIYEPYFDVCEFENDGPTQERAFYRIYFEDKGWPNDMNTLIFGLNTNIDDRLVYEGLDEMRLNCKQVCETPKPYCQMCDKVLYFERAGRKWAEEQVKQEEEQITPIENK